jgi:3-phosphoshikimate 1-carboxyvinyltransferase
MDASSDRTTVRATRLARPGLDACVRVPGSKSITNRALLLAALADGESTLTGALSADDTLAFASGLRDLGVVVDLEAQSGWRVQGAAGRIPRKEARVYCAEAGTAARFLLAACAAGHGRYTLDAAPQLRRRPLSLLLDALRKLGARTEPPDAVGLPLVLEADGLSGGVLELPGNISSQFVSALLMAAPLAHGPVTVNVEGLVSRPYVDMTLTMMEQFGVSAERDGHRAFRLCQGAYRARTYAVEPDASTASYFAAASAVTGGRVKILGLHRTGSLQGDAAFLDVLETMGCMLVEEPDGIVVTGPATLAGLTVDMSDISDTFMTLAAIAPFADSPVTMTGIANVRLKESDRIDAMESNLRRLGVRTESGPGFLRVHPGRPAGGRIDSCNDHRIAMSFAVLGLRVPGLAIADPACVSKTCPSFFELWSALEARAVAEVEGD